MSSINLSLEKIAAFLLLLMSRANSVDGSLSLGNQYVNIWPRCADKSPEAM